ncbi:bifunctional nicotinamidase/pyrazinamidase [Algoriphagus sp. oki45]|uniref:bifunctional nicotinamidase/pyrazinamidase n=1 Tax=Algoriphagus sp. oki45 TaxID=3067294 RepID=UPI0027F5AA1A|nr:bifunctional nicotinamidase/pyrazinamidase [Algoriphagus sp. oki45]
MSKNKDEVLLIVDVQNDFIPGGALEVSGGDEIVPLINRLQEKFDRVIATQDFHPADHGSFASEYEGKNPGEIVKLGGLDQVLWSDHCVQGTNGADFHPDLSQEKWEAVFQKGKNKLVDSYSGFFDNARRGDTGLGSYLKEKGVQKVYVCGLALDYCVKFTALDSNDLGFETFLIQDATRPVNLQPEDGEKAKEELQKAGVKIINSQDI